MTTNETYEMNYIKSCNAMIRIKEGSTRKNININYINRYHMFDTNLKNNYVYDLLNKIESIHFKEKIDDNNNIFTCQTNIDSIIKVIKYNKKKDREYSSPYLKLMLTHNNVRQYLCTITEENSVDPNKIHNMLPLYFRQIILNKDVQEKKFLDKYEYGYCFQYEDDDFIIYPTIESDLPITPQKMKQWNIIMDYILSSKLVSTEKLNETLLSFLENIKFVLFFKIKNINEHMTDEGIIKMNKFKNIFDFVDCDDKEKIRSSIKLLKNIKNIIKTFYKENLFYEVIDDSMIYITINANSKYQFLYIEFNLFNYVINQHYVSYIKYKKNILLNQLIEILELKLKNKDAKITYFTKIEEDDPNIQKYCENNLEYLKNMQEQKQIGGAYIPPYRRTQLNIKSVNKQSIMREIFGQIIDTPHTKVGSIPDDIVIINEYDSINKRHLFCSEYILIKVKDTFFRLSCKIITFDMLLNNEFIINKNNKYTNNKYNNSKYNQFKQQFTNKLFHNFNCLDNLMVEYIFDNKTDDTMYYTFNTLPAVIELYVSKVDINYKLPYRIIVKETADHYNCIILPKIKQNAEIKSSIILELLWKSEYRRLFKLRMINKDILNSIINGKLLIIDNINNFIQFTQKMLKIPKLALVIMDDFKYTDNFTFNIQLFKTNLDIILYLKHLIKNKKISIIRKKWIDTIIKNNNDFYKTDNVEIDIFDINNFKNFFNKSALLYLLWYTPEITITNYNKLFDYMDELYQHLLEIPIHLDNYDQLFESVKDYNTNKLNIEKCKIKEICNFYDLFEKDDFVHNIRHLTHNHKIEIDKLFKQIYFKNQQIQLDITAHYPTWSKYQIYHMHTFYRNSNTFEEFINNVFNISSLKGFLWDKCKYIDYSEATIHTMYESLSKINETSNFDNYIGIQLQ